MHRRRFLAVAAGGAATGLAGCLGGTQRQPVVVRAMPAAGNETDVECPLSDSFVADHPELESVLAAARGHDRYQWARVGVSEETAGAIVEGLHHHCEAAGSQDGGLYRYDGQYYFVSVTPRGTSTAGLESVEGH